MKKFIFVSIATIVLLEILLRIFLVIPTVYPWDYGQDKTMFVRKNFDGYLPNDTYIDFSTMWKSQSEGKDYPNSMAAQTDNQAFRIADKSKAKDQLKGGVLLLGDSVTFGWPYNYNDTHLKILDDDAQTPVAACGFLATSPVQLLKILDTRCGSQMPWKMAILQLTINDRFTFPDSLFLDSFGLDFQSKVSYLSFSHSETTFKTKDWFHLTPKDEAAVKEYAEGTFNNHNIIYKTYLARLLFFLVYYRPYHGQVTPITELGQMLQTISDEEKISKTLPAILAIKEKLKVPLTVYVHGTHPQAYSMNPRTDVQLLIKKLEENGIHVYDQRADPEFLAMKTRYYLFGDLHPNKNGYRFFGEKIRKLINASN
jgi:hypothetical protein